MHLLVVLVGLVLIVALVVVVVVELVVELEMLEKELVVIVLHDITLIILTIHQCILFPLTYLRPAATEVEVCAKDEHWHSGVLPY